MQRKKLNKEFRQQFDINITQENFKFFLEKLEERAEGSIQLENLCEEVLSGENIQNFEAKIKHLDSLVQRLHYLLVAEKFRLVKKVVYSAHYYDFRGRIYPNSLVGFTYLKILRPAFQIKSSNLALTDLQESTYYKYIQSMVVNIPRVYLQCCKGEEDQYYLKILLLELGKLNKTKLLARVKTSNISFALFVEEGL